MSETEEKFVHLHNHSIYSLLDGFSSTKDMAKYAKELGFKSLAITDHGSCGGLYHFQKDCVEQGIKPILGLEAYISNDHLLKEGQNYHIVLLAKNRIGLKNIMKLSTISELNGKYKKPRIDFNLLKQYKEGIICSTACSAGQISCLISENKIEEAKKLALQYKELFGEDFYIELMQHTYFKDKEQEEKEKMLVKELYKLSKELNIKAIATNDCHYLRKNEHKYHDVLLSMQTKNIIKNPKRFTFDSDEFYMKSYEEMLELYKDMPEVLSNTVEISNKIEVGLFKPSSELLPNFYIPEGFKSEEEYLKALVKDGMIVKGLINKPEYRERIKFEMQVIVRCKYIRYFLILWDVLNWAQRNGISVGVGRGSAVGSLVLYVLDVTKIDPIKHDLLFERFLNPDRISPPDVDIDFDYFKRDEIIKYVQNKYGIDHCCKIGTYQSLKARSIVRYVVKAMDLGNDWEALIEEQKINPNAKLKDAKRSLKLSDLIAKTVPPGPKATIAKSYKEVDEFRLIVDKYPGLIDNLMHIEKVLGSSGVHASGFVICRDPITEHIPLRNNKDQICCQFEGPEVEELGLLKFDFLGLKNITIIDKTVRSIKERTGKIIDIDKIEPNDKKIFDLLNGKVKGYTNKGIFQFESFGMEKLLREIRVDDFNDMIVANALYRPGPLGANVHTLYCDYKHKRKKIEPLHPKMIDILSKTYSLICYQEDVMKISRELAGFSRGESDTLRKCIKGDTLFISKKRGFITVEKLIKKGFKNDLFLSMNEKGEQEWVRIKDIWCNGLHRVTRLQTRSGNYIDVTKHHQILTDSGWKAKMRINKNDFISCADIIEYDGKDIISENMAIIIAGLLTEGYFVRKASRFVNFNKTMMSTFVNACKKEFGIDLVVKLNTVSIPLEYRKKINKYMKYGLSAEKEIPDVMMGLTKETTRKFLSFMLAAEGGFTKSNRQFEFSSKSFKMIRQVKLLLLRFGISSILHLKKIKGREDKYWRLYINNISDQEKLANELFVLMPEEKKNQILSGLFRKKNSTLDIFPQTIIKKMVDQYPFVSNYESGTFFTSNLSRDRLKSASSKLNDSYWFNFFNGKHRFEQVKSTDMVVSKCIRTYDFTVEEGKCPSIIANGIVIHNCIGKKEVDKMAKQREKFIAGCLKNNISREVANKIFDQIDYFGGYGFNKCLSGETLILNKLDNFKYKLKDLCDYKFGSKYEKYIVLDSYKNGKIVEDEVIEVFETGEKELYEIELSNGMKIKSTLNHKFLCSDKEFHTINKIIENNLEILYD